MCLIIHKPAGRRISAEFLSHVWRANDHGWGVFRLVGGVPTGDKGMELEGLQAANATLAVDEEACLHLRQATYGCVQPTLAHPHVVREGLLLMHNGSIHHLAPRAPGHSDSTELAAALRSLLLGLDADQAADLLRSEGFRRLVAPLVKGSMVVLLDHRGLVRLGRDWHRVRQGEWHADMQGIAVSNTHAWTPLCTQPWQQAWRLARRRWAMWVAHPLAAARAASGG